MPKVIMFPHSCKGMEDCGICAFVCPKALFTVSEQMNEAGYLPPNPPDEMECTSCGNCMVFCPDFAIVVEDARSTEGEEPNHG
ncbi:MAG: 4Fe-4S binding protein [Desulfobacteraceae bacterium]|jgi:2-oxoglutarate ferredoxin oxidoreductase subunit delta